MWASSHSEGWNWIAMMAVLRTACPPPLSSPFAAITLEGAREVLDLLRSLHVYTSQLPQHGEQISQILQVALLSYVRR